MGQKSNVEVVVPTQFVLEDAVNKTDTYVSNYGDKADSMGAKMDSEEENRKIGKKSCMSINTL